MNEETTERYPFHSVQAGELDPETYVVDIECGKLTDWIESYAKSYAIEQLTHLLRFSIEIKGSDVERTGKGRYNAVTTDSIQDLIKELEGN